MKILKILGVGTLIVIALSLGLGGCEGEKVASTGDSGIQYEIFNGNIEDLCEDEDAGIVVVKVKKDYTSKDKLVKSCMRDIIELSKDIDIDKTQELQYWAICDYNGKDVKVIQATANAPLIRAIQNGEISLAADVYKSLSELWINPQIV